MSTRGVNGQGNVQLPNLYANIGKKNPIDAQGTKISTPIPIVGSNTVQRQELGLINPYNSSDTVIAETREIASATNQIMADLGYQNFKVSPKTVASVTDTVNQYTLPAMNLASDNAVAARVADPKGPFADLFA